MTAFTYLLPIRRRASAADAEFTAYLRWVASRAELIVVDGSSPSVFAEHSQQWGEFSKHVPPAPHVNCRNGKVRGVLTGLAHASNDFVVIADDDVRYDERSLNDVLEFLDRSDLVAPQNYFDPTPWHANWDTARSLVNRAFGADAPGTLALRRSALPAHGYDGDVLFENLELMRTVAAAGGQLSTPIDCYVRRLPPTASHFFSQRVRQAYDEFARPLRLAAALCVVPAVMVLVRRGARRSLLLACGMPMLVATSGRLRGGGRSYFARRAVLFAPLWVAERGVCAWLALWWRMRGGCPYSSTRIKTAAHSTRQIRRLGSAA
jgi:hypothetical protein